MFWKTLNWIQDNWKSIALLGIPVILSFIASLLRKNESLEKKVELKEAELEVQKDAEKLEDELVDTAEQARTDAIKKVLDEHKETLAALAEEERKTIESIGSAEEATQALKIKLAQLSIKPHEVRPPKFIDPRRASKVRLCPCGSGLYYRHCHGRYWKPE